MLKQRLIPVVLMRNGVAVQSKAFRRYQVLGNPVTIVERLSDWASDELIYLDISNAPEYDQNRNDLADPYHQNILDIVEEVAARCFMPLTFGGRIRSVSDAAQRIERGADKITINAGPLHDPNLIDALSAELGAQCVVACIDVRHINYDPIVFADGGRTKTALNALDWARQCEARGAGEILLQSIDKDGSGQGYDVDLIRQVAGVVDVPVVALGGVGCWEHLREGLDAGADAVAAANIFNFTEHAVHDAKQFLVQSGANMRPTSMTASLVDTIPVEAA